MFFQAFAIEQTEVDYMDLEGGYIFQFLILAYLRC
jgi:hypothetical protein